MSWRRPAPIDDAEIGQGRHAQSYGEKGRALCRTGQTGAVLRDAARGRAQEAPLLLQSNAELCNDPSQLYRKDVHAIVEGLDLDPETVTAYSLRYSSIVRQLLRNVPVRVVAAAHDTFVVQIEKNYSAHITPHSDDVSRCSRIRRCLPVTSCRSGADRHGQKR